ncbi:hypothetical protein JZ751_017448 [Albula glossodonta]|uniref:LRRNT domain-containing protein n=1 Tax=Albula glossodonta TaxID=121402 RepID=A0A8T2PNI0_9TELE|nr:hypothetical protein JZ751_017448 [Albula glossodonta]
MLPCVLWFQSLLVLLSSVLLSHGENCPTSCLCPDPHTVDCSGRGLTRLPDTIPLDVRRLLLSDNWIPRIPADFLVLYSDLVYLDLRNNSLSRIEPGTLSTSSRLVFLDLGSNNLTEIPKGTFGESRSLIKLRLGNNPYLSMVSEDAFRGLTSLRELELERNALSSLQVGALSQLPSLRVVRLEGNPWVCNCNFANLFTWLITNRHKLPNALCSRMCFSFHYHVPGMSSTRLPGSGVRLMDVNHTTPGSLALADFHCLSSGDTKLQLCPLHDVGSSALRKALFRKHLLRLQCWQADSLDGIETGLGMFDPRSITRSPIPLEAWSWLWHDQTSQEQRCLAQMIIMIQKLTGA